MASGSHVSISVLKSASDIVRVLLVQGLRVKGSRVFDLGLQG